MDTRRRLPQRPSSHSSRATARKSDHRGRINIAALTSRAARRRRVLVFQPTPYRWKIVEAEIGGDRITIIRAQTLTRKADAAPPTVFPDLGESPKAADVVLLSNSDRAVCRLLQLPEASAEQTRRMVALRLETELPYPVAESVWACERQAPRDARPGPVLVIATPADEMAQDEDELREAGLRCRSVEFDVAALAQIAIAAGSTDDCLAAVCVDDGSATLTITEAGELRYVRRIPVRSEEASPSDSRFFLLSNELDQSIHDYLLQIDSTGPNRILVFGNHGVAEALKNRTDIPVETANPPEILRVADPKALQLADLMSFAACLGSVIAAHRRLHGDHTVAPALRRRRTALAESRWRRRFVLIGANVLLFAALIAGAFAVRAATLRSATRLIDEVQPYLGDLERLEEEVKLLQMESAEKRPMLDVFLALAEVMPKGVAIATLKIDSKGRTTISGKTPTVELVSDNAISAMEASPLFLNPEFLGTTREKEGLTFRMTCQLRKGSWE